MLSRLLLLHKGKEVDRRGWACVMPWLGVPMATRQALPWPLQVLSARGHRHGLFSMSSAVTGPGCRGQSAKGRLCSARTCSDGPLLPTGISGVHSEPAGEKGPRYPLVAPKEPLPPRLGV